MTGYCNVSTISNCHVTNDSEGSVSTESDFAGGIAGMCSAGSVVTGCSVENLSISALSTMGGIAGHAYSTVSFELCHAENITLDGKYGGGLIGGGSNTNITKSYIDGLTNGPNCIMVYPISNGATLTDTTLAYLNLDPDGRYYDDGSQAAVVKMSTATEEHYFSSLVSALEEMPGGVTILDGAVIDDSSGGVTVEAPVQLEGSARVEYGTAVMFENKDYIPDTGKLIVDGVLVVYELPLEGASLSGDGLILMVSDDSDAITPYSLDFSPMDASLEWMADEDNPNPTIDSAEDLRGLALAVNYMGIDFRGYTITLGSDIDLGNEPWTPIGRGVYPTVDTNTPFNGTFDGNGHTISNLYVDEPDLSMVGLFGMVYTGTLRDVTVVNANVTGDKYVGAVVGWYGNAEKDLGPAGTLEGCTVGGSVQVAGTSTVGGLVGELIADARDCSVNADGDVAGTGDNIGGFAGYIQRHGDVDGKVDGISVSCLRVSGTGEVGGVIGSVGGKISLSDCSASGMTVAAVDGDGSEEDEFYSMGIGGLFGTLRGTGNSVTGCSVEDTDLIANGQPAGYIVGVQNDDVLFDNVSYSDDCTGATVDGPAGTVIVPGEPDHELPPWGWDDNDEYVPPVVPVQPSDSGEGDTTKIVACAAAAVVAALMAVFLIIERRRS